MTRISRIVAAVTAGALISLGLTVPARAVPPEPYCYGGPGPAWDVTYKGVRVHLAVYCQWLDAGNSWYFGHARMTMQRDGNLVIYDQSNRARWSSRTNGSGATQLVFQQDGNLVLYTAGYARAVWASNTRQVCRNPPYNYLTETLGMQSDSNFVIYCRYETDGSDLHAIWSTGTVF